MKSIALKTRFENHPIHIGENLLAHIPTWLAEVNAGRKVIIITNTTVWKAQGLAIKKVFENSPFESHTLLVPEGESHKTLATIDTLVTQLLEKKVERRDTIIAFGGGIIGDMAGFAASIYLRGIRLIQVPTSLLAQVDAAIGGKTGVNHPMGKNLIGTFYQPLCTVIDIGMLDTLPKKEVLCGLAEIVKYGIIGNPGLFKYLETHKEKVATLDIPNHRRLWESLIRWSCADKAAVVSADERESGLRETLNFGHTIGHGIEAANHYTRYLHGEAVALGMKAALYIAEHIHFLEPKSARRMRTLLADLGFTLTLDPSISPESILQAMRTDKKIRDGKYRFILPTGVGSTITVDDIPPETVAHAIASLYA